MSDEDLTHYCDLEAGGSSPCGNEDPESYVSPHYEDVSCQLCLHYLNADKSVKKPTFH